MTDNGDQDLPHIIELGLLALLKSDDDSPLSHAARRVTAEPTEEAFAAFGNVTHEP
jgi:hypothetical protein